MKSLVYLSAILILSSCAKMVAPPYSTVEKITRITPGMTATQVTTSLGIPPFDIYHMSATGSTIHIYNYKLKERKNKGCSLLMMDFYTQEKNLTVGQSYYTKQQLLYVLFDKGKLVSLITDAGRDDSADLLILNNTIHFIAKTERHALLYEKLELGQKLVKLDSQGHFKKKSHGGFLSGVKTKKQGCGKGLLGLMGK